MPTTGVASPLARLELRARRFFSSFRPRLEAGDRSLAEEWLNPRQMALFGSQSGADQKHSIAVARLLLRSGYSSRDLIVAALLHDVGKREAVFTPWHRTAIVVTEAIAPWLLRLLARRRHVKLLAPFWAHTVHAAAGSEFAARAGVSDRAVYLIRSHHTRRPAGDEELCMLGWADSHA
ncbi:MAG: hypothetical protein ACYC5O_06065 [Anaerolineae bacterium]